MLQEGDLFVSLLGSATDAAPRVGMWREDVELGPALIPSLTLNEARLLAAISLPVELSSDDSAPREVELSISAPFSVPAHVVEQRGINATARHRAWPRLAAALRERGADPAQYWTVAAPYEARRVRCDVVEILRAARERDRAMARRILSIAASSSWDAPAAVLDGDALNLEPGMIAGGVRALLIDAVRMAGDDEDDSPDRAPPPSAKRARRRRLVGAAGAALVVGVAALLGAVALRGGDDVSGGERVIPHGPKVALVIHNMVPSGARGELPASDGQVQLSRRARPFCAQARCIAGTERDTGQLYRYAVCQRQEERTARTMTNGNLQQTEEGRADDHNPHLYSSRRYYGVRLRNGTQGYVSDVWVTPAQRAGKLALPPCPPGFASS